MNILCRQNPYTYFIYNILLRLKQRLHDHEFDTNLGKIVIYKIRARIDKKYKFSCADKILSRVPSIRHEVIPT